jgi:hypothetical protein
MLSWCRDAYAVHNAECTMHNLQTGEGRCGAEYLSKVVGKVFVCRVVGPEGEGAV